MKEPMELGAAECLELLSGEVFGRLAVTTPAGPRIVPLNYVVLDDAVVFRTTPYSEVARYAVGEEAAFEIDGVDHARQTGWSVVVAGRVEEVDDSELSDVHKVWVPMPWAGGPRNLYLRLRWHQVTGRRLREAPATTVPDRPLP